MNAEVVKFKGGLGGISLVFDENADYEAIEKDVREKLESGADFFACGTTVLLKPGQLSEQDETKLTKLFRQYGVLVRRAQEKTPKRPVIAPREEKHEVEETNKPAPIIKAPVQTISEKPQAQPKQVEMSIIDHTIRGGQEISVRGSVLICGNVNPGAQVIAGGSIDIRGTCRGIVHAGAYGDASAFIIADHLMPVQIRIAGYIAQAPEQMSKPNCAERASVKDGHIVIEPIER